MRGGATHANAPRCKTSLALVHLLQVDREVLQREHARENSDAWPNYLSHSFHAQGQACIPAVAGLSSDEEQGEGEKSDEMEEEEEEAAEEEEEEEPGLRRRRRGRHRVSLTSAYPLPTWCLLMMGRRGRSKTPPPFF